ncbi:MAG: acid phosphatase type 7 [Micromonosporaceae bacterium]|nr:acid phosphatase type 7 [Micromonosporaceae bacterium]
MLTGHDHDYERFAKLNADGQPDDQAGLRSFVAGTGGRSLRAGRTPHAGSEKLIDDAMGFLELRLRPDSYSWRFLSIDGTALDEGEDRCH